MRRLVVFTLSTLFPLGLAAQDTPEARPNTPPAAVSAPQGRLSGHVVCDDTRRPARGALVMALPLPQSEGAPAGVFGFSDALTHVRSDGTYLLEHVPPGEYTVSAALPGYLSPFEDFIQAAVDDHDSGALRAQLARSGTVALRSGETANFDVHLRRGAALTGRVLYDDGAPASQITLVLEDVNAKPSTDIGKAQQQRYAMAFARMILSHQPLETDDQGRFRLVGLQPGTYRLAAAEPIVGPFESGDGGMAGIGMLISGIPDPHALLFYSGDTPHRAAAKTYELRAGDEVPGIEITLPVDAFHEVRGTVAAKDGRPINMGEITLTDSSDATLALNASVERDGSFVLHQVPTGSYMLSVSHARIGKTQIQGASADNPNVPLLPVSAFADGGLSVLVKDNDLSGINVALDEVTMPKGETQQAALPNTDED